MRQGGCERRSKVFVNIQKKKKFSEGGGVGRGTGEAGSGGVRSGVGGGWGSKVWGRWVMWGNGDANQE